MLRSWTTMYEFASCMSTSASDDYLVDDKQSASLALALAADTSLHHHQTVGSTSGAGQTRGTVDLSVTGHSDDFSPPASSSSSSSSSAEAAAAVASAGSNHQRPAVAGGNSNCPTVKEPLDYVNGLHIGELFGGANIHSLLCR